MMFVKSVKNTFLDRKLKKSLSIKPKVKKILLIDDDASFRSIMKTVAASKSIQITAFKSLKDLSSPRDVKKFDLVLLDYLLMDHFDGLEVAKYIDTFFSFIPVILISGDKNLVQNKNWPSCIKKFISKDLGVYQITKQVNIFLN